jgi:hypothetical protein
MTKKVRPARRLAQTIKTATSVASVRSGPTRPNTPNTPSSSWMAWSGSQTSHATPPDADTAWAAPRRCARHRPGSARIHTYSKTKRTRKM